MNANFSITQILYGWMRQKRIIADVARQMGVRPSTLSGELRPENPQAKLGADSLVPLFGALRKLGYTREVRGILMQFTAALQGQYDEEASPDDFVAGILTVNRCLGYLSERGASLASLEDEDQLVSLRNMITTELSSAVERMEAAVQLRLQQIHSKGKGDPDFSSDTGSTYPYDCRESFR
jgi:hypothetical protein